MPGFIELKDVRKIYRMGEVEIKAVDGINFSIERGEFVVIVGPSGAGKTTVLNILGGWIRPLAVRCGSTTTILPNIPQRL